MSARSRDRIAGTANPAPPVGDQRLLEGWVLTGQPQDYHAHHARFGHLLVPTGREGRAHLSAEVTRSGLSGRGGAGFPTGRKLTGVAAGRGAQVVVGNGCEGEPSSQKDLVLAELSPHLILDGALVAAALVGAKEIYLCAHRDGPIHAALAHALDQRPHIHHIKLVAVPDRFVTSEESALVNFLNGGDARPTSKPPRVFERGVHGRPTFVSNIETLAQLALVARYGADWFRSVGTEDSPGTAVITVGGAVRHPGVVEMPYGRSLSAVLDSCGGVTEPLQAVLVGGFSGGWLPWPGASSVGFSHADLRAAGGTVGVASVIALPARCCGVAETARILDYLARESANQCGPCMFGLPAIAADLAAVTTGAAHRDRGLRARLERRLVTITGRGACAHPDGAVRLAESALVTFSADIHAHLAGRPCRGAGAPGYLPVPREQLPVMG